MKKTLSSELKEVYQTVESTPTPTPSSALAPTSSSASVPSSQSPALAPDSAATKVGLWADFDTQVASSQHHRSVTTDVIIEMCRYSEGKTDSQRKGSTCLVARASSNLPRLKQTCFTASLLKYLGIVATSVPAERMFSKAGEVVSKKRNRLKGKTVNMLLFLNKNL